MAGRAYKCRPRRSSFAKVSATALSSLVVTKGSYRLLRQPAVERATEPWDSRCLLMELLLFAVHPRKVEATLSPARVVADA